MNHTNRKKYTAYLLGLILVCSSFSRINAMEVKKVDAQEKSNSTGRIIQISYFKAIDGSSCNHKIDIEPITSTNKQEVIWIVNNIINNNSNKFKCIFNEKSGCLFVQAISPNSIIENVFIEGIKDYKQIRKKVRTVSFKGNITSIGNYAFQNCRNLKNIIIPNSVQRIGEFAFGYCTSLKNIKIPDSVEKIESSAFQGCTKLKSIKLPNLIEKIPAALFSGCKNLEFFSIPDKVKEIEGSAFFECSKLSFINLPDSLEKIGASAFTETGLKSIVIPAKVKIIKKAAFSHCKDLVDIKLPASLEEIGESLFFGCKSLISVEFPEEVKFPTIE